MHENYFVNLLENNKKKTENSFRFSLKKYEKYENKNVFLFIIYQKHFIQHIIVSSL